MKKILIVSLIGLIMVLALSPSELGETITDLPPIKILPADYNPYQSLYDEMLAPTVRISSASGIGSGVVISHRDTENTEKSIYILTANHVVGNNTSVTVTVYSYISNTQASLCNLCAFVVVTDTNKDLALLRINPPVSPFVKGGLRGIYSAKLAPKDYTPYLFTPVWTVGCSLGLKPRPSFGHLCALGDSVANYWEVSSPILPGNSGGPVYDANTHEVIGIAVWVHTYQGQLITTMAGVVPIQSIYEFLNETTNGH